MSAITAQWLFGLLAIVPCSNVLLAFPRDLEMTPRCDPGWNFEPSSRRCVKMFIEGKTYLDAKQTCINSHNGNLMNIHDQESDLFVQDLLGDNAEAWIALNDFATDGDFTWSDGKIMHSESYSNWAPIIKSDYNMVFLTHRGICVDRAKTGLKKPVVCQKPADDGLTPCGEDPWKLHNESNICMAVFSTEQLESGLGILYCLQMHNAKVVRIPNKATQDFVLDLLDFIPEAWITLDHTNEPNNTDVYTNWAPNHMCLDGNTSAVYVTSQGWREDHIREIAKRPYICQKSANAPTINLTCPTTSKDQATCSFSGTSWKSVVWRVETSDPAQVSKLQCSASTAECSPHSEHTATVSTHKNVVQSEIAIGSIDRDVTLTCIVDFGDLKVADHCFINHSSTNSKVEASRCDPEWYFEPSTGICVNLFSEAVLFQSAKKECQATYGGHLVDIHTEETNTFIQGLIEATDVGAWAALNELSGDGHFMWSDGTMMHSGSYSNWAPNNIADGLTNSAFLTKWGTCLDSADNFASEKSFVCEKFPYDDESCDNRWTLNPDTGTCMVFVPGDVASAYGSLYCKIFGGFLTRLHNNETVNYIRDLMGAVPEAWVGIADDWVDGQFSYRMPRELSLMMYKRGGIFYDWAPNHMCKDGNTSAVYVTKQGWREDRTLEKSKKPYICQMPSYPPAIDLTCPKPIQESDQISPAVCTFPDSNWDSLVWRVETYFPPSLTSIECGKQTFQCASHPVYSGTLVSGRNGEQEIVQSEFTAGHTAAAITCMVTYGDTTVIRACDLQAFYPLDCPKSFLASRISKYEVELEWNPADTNESSAFIIKEIGSGVEREIPVPLELLSQGQINVTGLEPGTDYEFNLIFVDKKGKTFECTKSKVKITTDFESPLCPTSLSLTNKSNTQVTLQWVPGVKQGDGHMFALKDASNDHVVGSVAHIDNDVMEITVSSLEANKDYTFYLEAHFGEDLSTYCRALTVEVVTDPDPPYCPSSFKVGDISRYDVSLQWTSGRTEESAQTFLILEPGNGTEIKILHHQGEALVQTNVADLEPGISYEFTLRVKIDEDIDEKCSNMAVTFTTSPELAFCPTSFSSPSCGSTEAILQWHPGVVEKGSYNYFVVRDLLTGEVLKRAIHQDSRLKVKRVTVKLKADSTYAFELEAFDFLRNGSKVPRDCRKLFLNVTTTPGSCPNSFKSVHQSGNKVTLKWTPGPNSTEDLEYIITDGNSGAPYLAVRQEDNSGSITGEIEDLKPETRYKFVLKVKMDGVEEDICKDWAIHVQTQEEPKKSETEPRHKVYETREWKFNMLGGLPGDNEAGLPVLAPDGTLGGQKVKKLVRVTEIDFIVDPE